MAEISFGGLATGLPTEELVSSLMAIERRPLERLEADKEYESERLKAYSQFNSRLDDLRSAVSDLRFTNDVRTTSVNLSSDEDLSATSNGGAPGNYEISVVQLAQVQKTITSGYGSKSETVFGTGFFAVGDTGIQVDETNNSLEGLMNSINSISEETGVRASIINDGGDSDNYHMVLTGDDASTSFSLTYNFADADGDPIDFSATTVRSARQAMAYVDGMAVVSNSNTLSDTISGVSINLNQASEILVPASGDNPPVYATTILNVEGDSNALKEKVSTFVSAYNEIMDWIGSGYDSEAIAKAKSAEEGEDAEENLSSLLRGDATINDIKRNLQSILTDSVGNSGSFQILSEIGIATQKDGTLLFNEGKFNAALQDGNFEDAVKLLAGEGEVDGVMKKFNSYLLSATSVTDGMYAEKRDRYESAVGRLDDQIAQKETMMDKVESRIRAQFNAMELLVSNLNAQSDYLTQQMDMLSNLSTGKRR